MESWAPLMLDWKYRWDPQIDERPLLSVVGPTADGWKRIKKRRGRRGSGLRREWERLKINKSTHNTTCVPRNRRWAVALYLRFSLELELGKTSPTFTAANSQLRLFTANKEVVRLCRLSCWKRPWGWKNLTRALQHEFNTCIQTQMHACRNSELPEGLDSSRTKRSCQF